MESFSLFKNFVFDPIFEIIYFPIWWYTKGLANFFNFLKEKFLAIASPFVLKVLFANLVKPMYGDWTIEGRIISLVMRFLQLAWRLLKVVFIFIVFLSAMLFYLLILPFIFYELFCNAGDTCRYFIFPSII